MQNQMGFGQKIGLNQCYSFRRLPNKFKGSSGTVLHARHWESVGAPTAGLQGFVFLFRPRPVQIPVGSLFMDEFARWASCYCAAHPAIAWLLIPGRLQWKRAVPLAPEPLRFKLSCTHLPEAFPEQSEESPLIRWESRGLHRQKRAYLAAALTSATALFSSSTRVFTASSLLCSVVWVWATATTLSPTTP